MKLDVVGSEAPSVHGQQACWEWPWMCLWRAADSYVVLKLVPVLLHNCPLQNASCLWRDEEESMGKWETRATRMPAFWGYPLPPHDYPYHRVILDPKSKDDQVKVTNLKNSPKFQILKQPLHTTHLLKLLDKMMCKYDMDPMSIVADTEWTRFCPQMDRWTDGKGETSIHPFNFVEVGVK